MKNKNKDSENDQKSIQIDDSIICKYISGKFSIFTTCEEWIKQNHYEKNFRILSLPIPSKKEVLVHLKFYPFKPIKGDMMIDYEFTFERSTFSIFKSLWIFKLINKIAKQKIALFILYFI